MTTHVTIKNDGPKDVSVQIEEFVTDGCGAEHVVVTQTKVLKLGESVTECIYGDYTGKKLTVRE